MKILVLNGSPKEKSSTMLMVNAFLKGLNSKENNEIKIVSTIKKNIKYCQGDLSCWFRQDRHCVIQDDDMNELLDDMVASDMIIWSFPLHCHGVPASLKAVLDRTIAFLKFNMEESENCIEHKKTIDLSKKKNIFIVGGGYPYYPDNFASIKLQMQIYFKNPTMICVCQTALLDVEVPELEALKNNLYAQLNNAGMECVRNGQISKTVIDEIEKPLLPNDVYIDMINHMQ